MGLDGWTYGLHECDEDGLAPFLRGLGADWAGLSLTMPLKRRAMELADRVSPTARAVGGANTLVRADDGSWGAYNTDVEGITTALSEAGVKAPRRCSVLGAGATAASALAALRELGVHGPVTLLARDVARTVEVSEAARRLGLDLGVAPLEDLEDHLDVDLVVSTLPSGATDRHGEALGASRADLFDVVYAPWPTEAARAVAGRGGRVVGGFPMLLHQAAAQVRLMTGRDDVPVEAMRVAGETELDRRARAARN